LRGERRLRVTENRVLRGVSIGKEGEGGSDVGLEKTAEWGAS
jgi:hypothetical protein